MMTSETPPSAIPERGLLYGRRKGRPLHKRKAALVAELLPKIQVRIPAQGSLTPELLFDKPVTGLQLEIGFGGGEHLAGQAEAHPTDGFIGCEPFLNGIASLLEHIDNRQIGNVRIHPNDARQVLDALPEGSLKRCFVLFPDPWPKARHAERRFIGPDNMRRLARALASGAELRMATDVMPLAEWMENNASAHPDFTLFSKASEPPADWVPTRYEQKGRAAGRVPVYLCYRRS